MSLYIVARIDALPGQEQAVLAELKRVIVPTRAEAGCLRVHVYQSRRESVVFFIHSEWKDEAAFDAHVKLLHTQQFIAAVETLVTNPVHAVRCNEIA